MHLIHGARVRCHPHGRGHPDPQPAQRGRAYFAKNLAEGKARKEALTDTTAGPGRRVGYASSEWAFETENNHASSEEIRG
jgi:hypothetical protein